MTILKIGAIRWDWEGEHMPTDDLNEVLRDYHEPVMIEHVDTKSDEAGLLVYNASSKLFEKLTENEKDKLWIVWQGLAAGDFTNAFPSDMHLNLSGSVLTTTVERLKEVIAEVAEIYGE